MKNSFWNNTMIFGLGFLLLRGISFFLLPIYTNLLPAYDTGIIFLIYTLLAFLNPIYAYGMNASLFKYYNNKEYDSTTTVSTSLISVFVSSCILSCILIVCSSFLNLILAPSGGVSSVNWFFWISLILFFDSLSARIFVLLRIQEKSYHFLFVSAVNICCSLIFNVLFIKYYGLESFGAVLSLFCVSLIQFFCLSPVVVPSFSFSKFNYGLLKTMLRFSIPFLPSALLFVVVGFSDRWFIKHYLGMDEVGHYGAGYKLGSIMSLVVTAFNLNWQPYYLKTKENIRKKFSAIGSVACLSFISIGVLLIFFVDLVMYIQWNSNYLIGKNFWSGLVVVPFVTLGYLFYGIYILQMPSIFILNKQNWGLVFWLIGTAVNVVGNMLLIPRLGILGASISTSLGYFVMMACLVYKNRVWLPVYYETNIIVIHLLLSFVVVFLKHLFGFSIMWPLGCLYLVYALFLVYKTQKKVLPDVL